MLPHAAEMDRVARVPDPLLADPNPGLLRALLHAIYDLTWVFFLLIASPWWLGRSIYDKSFRSMVVRRLTVSLPGPADSKRERLLVHGVSVGEIKGAQSLVQALAESHPELEVVLCTTTDTGEQVARKLYPDHLILRFPIDLSWCVMRFLKRVRPSSIVLIELEIWPNFLRCANQLGLPVAVVNGRITENSFGNYRIFRSALPQFNRISLFCAQDERYAERFKDLARSADRVIETGNIKIDGLRLGRVSPEEEIARLAGGAAGQVVLVAGSTHEREEVWFVESCRASFPEARLVLVPRHPQRTRDVERSLTAIGAEPQLLSRLRSGEALERSRPLLVDTIGELEGIYALADLVFIGGSLIEHGGQNMLEPAAQGRAVLYGPHVENFRQEARLLEAAGAARRVTGPEELTVALRELRANPARIEAMGRAGIRALEAQGGAAQVTLSALEERLFAPRAL